MDDVQCSADSKEELIGFKEESTKIMADVGFTLHKWHSHVQIVEHRDEVIQETINEETYAKTMVGTNTNETKILGTTWNKSSDRVEICFKQRAEWLES